MSRIGASALSVVLAAVLTLAVQTGVLILVAAVIVVVQGLLASAPAPADVRGRSIPTPRAAATMSAGLVSCIVALRPSLLLGADGSSVGQDGLISTGVMAGILPGVAVGVFVALVAQMLRRDDRRELVLSTSSAISLALFASLASAWIGAARAASGPDVVTIAAVGLAASLLVWMIPIDRFVCAAVAITVGAGASAAAARRGRRASHLGVRRGGRLRHGAVRDPRPGARPGVVAGTGARLGRLGLPGRDGHRDGGTDRVSRWSARDRRLLRLV